MSARSEKLIPLLIALILGVATGIVAYIYEIQPFPKALSAGTMTFGVVVAGFAATQRNMLLGMKGSSVLKFAVRTGFHDSVLAYLMHCVYAGLVVSVVSVVGFFINSNPLYWSVWFALLIGSIALVIALILRNEILMVRIVKRFMEDQ